MRTEDWQLNKEPSKFSSNSKVQSYNTKAAMVTPLVP